jgi:hypothetical protein
MGALLKAVEDLRADVREDIGHLRDDVREDNAALEHRVMTALGDFSVAHGREHTTEREASAAVHRRFDDFLRTAELNQARRDGALGVFRFLLEQTSRHAKPLTAVLLAAAGAALALAGNIRLEVVLR